MSLQLDRQRLQDLLVAMGDKLAGDWLLVGGALVALWLEPRRVTEDVDLVGLAGTQAERLALMQLAEDLGLPIEAVNSAADFFVRRIPGWDTELVLLHEGTSARIFRPSPTLFLLLKMRRLSEQDLAECEHLLEKVRIDALPVDIGRVLAELDELDRAPPRKDVAPLAEAGLTGQHERRQRLRALLLAA